MPDTPKRVLLVDDEPDLIRGARLWLRSVGYQTCEAHDGEQAVAAAAEEHPDAIILDVRMPRKNGLAVLAELKQREDTKRIPIVMLSASLVDQQRALDAGAKFFLSKPYAGKTLLAAVDAAVCSPESFPSPPPSAAG